MPRFEPLENRLLLATVTLNPSKDNTLYEDPAGALSNGQGELYAGRTGSNNGQLLRRALMAFDTTAIPAGSTVTAVNLDMMITRAQGGGQTMNLHKVTADWGEGSSFLPSPGGAGTAAASNDATWTHRFFNSATWATPGGDFLPAVSGSGATGGLGSTASWTGSGMIDDVQSWVDAPNSNFGWILLGTSLGSPTAKRFASSETGGAAPLLTVTFTEPATSLTLAISADSISESGGAGATTAIVSRSGSTSSALVVNLASDDTSEATVQSSVTIAAGQVSSSPFNIDAVDDSIVDGTQTVTVTASATDATAGSDTVDVSDDDVAALSLSIVADSIAENAGANATTATISRNTDTSSPLTVSLLSSDTSEVTVPSSVTISAGQQTSAAFEIGAVDDSLVDGTQTVTVTGSAAGHAAGTDTVDVTDDEVAGTVTGHLLNAARPNRSGLASLLLEFSQPVTLGTAGAIKVWNHSTGSALDISAATLANDGTTAVTVDLAGISFAAGHYTFKLPASLGLAATHTLETRIVPGDSTGDGQVTFADFGELAAAFNTLGGPVFGPGDLNGDGDVSFTDFGILANNFNTILSPVDMDFGDALQTGTSFPVTLPDGARHILGAGLLLGTTVDAELDGQPSAAATGDGADEDGVAFPALVGGTTPTIDVTAVVPGTAVLNAWIDFNRDGDWDDAGEQIFVDQVVVSGVNSLTATIPAGAAAGTAYARFRITGCTGHNYAGLAPDGEVEDYLVTLVAPALRPVGSGPFTLATGRATPAASGSTSDAFPGSETDSVAGSLAAQVVDLALERVLPEILDPILLPLEPPPATDLLEQIFVKTDDLLLGE